MKQPPRLRAAVGALLQLAAVAGFAGSPSAAAAGQYHLNSGTTSGPAVPLGMSYTASSSNFSFRTSTGGIVFSCSLSALSGATDAITSGGPSAGLAIAGASFSGCELVATGTDVKFSVPSSSLPWQLTPTGGTASPYTERLASKGSSGLISITLACSNGSATYSATSLTGTETNGSATMGGTPSSVSFANAGPLTNQTSVCALPKTVYVGANYALATVGGSPVTTGPGGNDFMLSDN